MNKKIVISVLLSIELLTWLVANIYASDTWTWSTQNKKEFKISVKNRNTWSWVLNNMWKMDKGMKFWKRVWDLENRHLWAMNKLTDAEKESLRTMTDEQKKHFLRKKDLNMNLKEIVMTQL